MNDLSSLKLGSDSWAIIWAIIGGLIVAAGLVIEEIADLLNERFLGGYKPHSSLRLFGWWMLMFGILIEVADAGWTAHEISLTTANFNRIDPANLPVLNMNAFVKLRVKGNLFPDLTKWDSIPISTNWGSKSATATLSGNIPSMISDDFGIGTGFPDSREYFLNFHMESVSAAMALPMQPALKSFSAANSISIDVRFLPPQSDIIDGYAFVVVNNSLWKLFRIYPQKSPQPPFPNKEQSKMLPSGTIKVYERLVVTDSRGMVPGVRYTASEPGKITSATNGESFPVEARFFMADFTIVGTNVPNAKFDENWRP